MKEKVKKPFYKKILDYMLYIHWVSGIIYFFDKQWIGKSIFVPVNR